MPKGIGLVLAGGGGKGAYQIGVWKALRKSGIDKNIVAVSGASVGALNSLLFTNGSLEIAENIWLNMRPEKVLSTDKSNDGGVLDSLLKDLGYKKERIKETYGIFSRKGIGDLIDKNINLSRVRNSHIQTFASVYNYTDLKLEYVRINGRSDDMIKGIVYASSALPVIYGAMEIGGRKYLDGGLPYIGDNVPVEPLLNLDLSMIIAVHIGKDSITKKIYKNIIEIVPTDEQGGLISGTLDFTPQGAARRIEQGYKDTMRIMKPVLEISNEGAKSINIARDILYNKPKTAGIDCEEIKRQINAKRRKLNG